MIRVLVGAALLTTAVVSTPARAGSDAYSATLGLFMGLTVGTLLNEAMRPPPPVYYAPAFPSPHVVWSPWQPYNPPIVYHRPQPTCGLIQVGTDHFGQPITQVFCR